MAAALGPHTSPASNPLVRRQRSPVRTGIPDEVLNKSHACVGAHLRWNRSQANWLFTWNALTTGQPSMARRQVSASRVPGFRVLNNSINEDRNEAHESRIRSTYRA